MHDKSPHADDGMKGFIDTTRAYAIEFFVTFYRFVKERNFRARYESAFDEIQYAHRISGTHHINDVSNPYASLRYSDAIMVEFVVEDVT